MASPNPTHARSRRARGASAAWRQILPREHGVWAWVGLPLLLALLLVPSLTAVLGALAVLAGLGATQALGRALRGVAGARGAAVGAALFAAGAGAGAWVGAERPGVILATLAGAGLFGASATWSTRGRPPRQVALEVVAIAVFVGTGAGLAIAAGAAPARVGVAALALLAWLVLGLWWVKGRLATVLARREPWDDGMWVAGGLVVVAVAAGFWASLPLVGCVPLAYSLRARAHRPPESARDAKRIGLQELAWGAAATVLLAVL
jgi:hypothetical protein